MTLTPYIMDNIDELEKQLDELKTAILANRDRIAATRGTTHAMQMEHSNMLSRYDALRQRIEYMKAVAPMMVAGAIAPAPVTKRITRVGDSQPIRRLCDAFPDRGEIYKAAGPRCQCASSHHRTCSFCGECQVLCGHRPV